MNQIDMIDIQRRAIQIVDIKRKDWQEACQKACEFIDCGIKNDGKSRPRTMDWEQDAPIIIPAVNKVNNADVESKAILPRM